jgi:hypothetical protein
MISVTKARGSVLLGLLLVSLAPSQNLAVGKLTDAEDARAYAAIVNQLNGVRATVAWKDATLADVLKELRVRLSRNFVIAPAAQDRAAIAISLELHDVTTAMLIRYLENFLKVRFVFEGGIIFVTTPEDAAKRRLEMRVYDVSDLLYQAPDFPAPPMGIHPGRPAAEPEEPAREARDSAEVVDLIRTLVGLDKWDAEGTSIVISHRLLIVRNIPEVHAEIRRLIQALAALL